MKSIVVAVGSSAFLLDEKIRFKFLLLSYGADGTDIILKTLETEGKIVLDGSCNFLAVDPEVVDTITEVIFAGVIELSSIITFAASPIGI